MTARLNFRIRRIICQLFIRFERDNNLKQTELAEMIGVDKSDAHRILHHRIDSISTDRLLGYLNMIKPDLNKLHPGLGGFAQMAMQSIPPSIAYDFAVNNSNKKVTLSADNDEEEF